MEPELNHQQQTETRTQLVQSWTEPRPISNISPEYCYVCFKVLILCVYLKSGLGSFMAITKLTFYCTSERRSSLLLKLSKVLLTTQKLP